MLDALTLDQMRTFVAVAESGSFRAGAARLSRVQSAISHAIGNLEGQLQVSLFDRSGHKPVLTTEGRALLSDVRSILVKVDAMRAKARGLGEGLELSLSIAVDPIVPLGSVAAALQDLHVRYPTVGVQIKTAPLGAALDAVLNRTCTMAITTAEMRDPQIETEALSPLPPFVAVCATSHPLSVIDDLGKMWTAVELADHLQIVVTDPSPMTEGQDFGVLSPETWRVSDLATKHAMILAGTGWGNLPLWMVKRDLDEGRLARVAVAALGAEAETALNAFLHRRIDEPLGPAARCLRDVLLTRFSQ